MKKLFTLLLSAVMAVACCFGLTACGDATFNGNYKAVTEDEQAAFVEAASEAERASISFENGADLSLSVKGKVKNDDSNINIDASVNLKAVAITVEEKTDYQAEVAVKAKIDGIPAIEKVNADVKAYYADATAYANGSVQIGKEADGKIDLKHFISIEGGDLSSLMGMASGMAGGDLPLDEVSGLLGANLMAVVAGYAAMASEQEGVNINLLFDIDAKKVKAEINVDLNGTKVNGALYLAFDEDYNLIAIKVDVKVTFDGNDISVNLSFKGYDGKVNLPSESERETYKDVATDAELQLKIAAIMGGGAN